MVLAAIGIVSHCIMGRIQKPFTDMIIRQKTFHSEIRFQKSVGIMFGSRIQKRKDGQVTFRVGGDQHIKVISMIKTVSGRIPSNITVRLGKITVAVAICNAVKGTVTDTVFAFPRRSDKWCPITGNGKIRGINQSPLNRLA